MTGFTAWLDRVGDHLSRVYEQETGHVLLTFFTTSEEEKLAAWFREGMKPKVAAHCILDARRTEVARQEERIREKWDE